MRFASFSRRAALISTLVSVAFTLFAAPARAPAASVLSFDVFCDDDGQRLGSITIDIAEQATETSGGRTAYGFKIQGGFDADPELHCPDANYRWIQAYVGQPTLYSWESPTAWSYDRSRSAADDKKIADGSPFYVNLRGPGYGHATLGYFDQPQDYLNLPNSDPTSGNEVIEFTFQTALVCFETGSNDIHMIDGFVWSFKWFTEAGTANFTLGSVEHSTAHFSDLMTAWNNDPDPDTLKNAWNLIDGGCCCPVPAPSAALAGLTLLAGLLVTRSTGHRLHLAA